MRAGLDPTNKHDRCQFFQAHGTGTQAGDPVEAEAISKAFLGPEARISDKDEVLFVGDIKTVIGHTEGTAGLAGVLAASLALPHTVIPSNFLFTQLNPTVKPFYHNLAVLLKPPPWPSILASEPRRASVNSFGFGRTNTHHPRELRANDSCHTCYEYPQLHALRLFCCMEALSLLAIIEKYATFLRSNESINLRYVSYTCIRGAQACHLK